MLEVMPVLYIYRLVNFVRPDIWEGIEPIREGLLYRYRIVNPVRADISKGILPVMPVSYI